MTIKHTLISDDSGWETYQTDFYLRGLYYNFCLNTFYLA